MTVLVFLVTILVLVGVHEAGHFLVARACGVYVREFAIGIGPVLVSTKRRSTKYSLRLIPIGGYVLMAGEDRRETGGEVPADQILYNKPPYVRAAISLSGAFGNILLALVVTFIAVWASTLPVLQVAHVLPGSPAAAVLEPGDRIVAIDGRTIYTVNQITTAIRRAGGGTIELSILRDGNAERVSATPRYSEQDGRYEIGAYFLAVTPTNEVTELEPASPLYAAGVRSGDRIMTVNGKPVETEVGLLVALDELFASSDPARAAMRRDLFAANPRGF